MGVEQGFLSSHTAATGTALLQTSPNFQVKNGETAVTAGQLMSVRQDGKAYLCRLNTPNCYPAGFAATNHPLGTTVDDTSKITLVRQGRIGGFTGLVPGALYFPSADAAGAVVPERSVAGPVITTVTAVTGTAFLRNIHIRAGHRPAAGTWTITFGTATTCRITPPGIPSGNSATVASNTAYNGTILGAEDFYIETRSIGSGYVATFTVSYADPAAVVKTLDSPGNAITAFAPLSGAAGRVITKGLYKVVTTASTATVSFNNGATSAAKPITAGTVYYDIIPGIALTLQSSAVTAETNYFNIDTAELTAPVGIAVNETTLQVLMGGIG